jgi:hypothetical protein
MQKQYMDNHHYTSLRPHTYLIYSASWHTRTITFPGINPISTTITTNAVTVPSLLNGEYAKIMPDSNTVLHSLGYIKMSLYADASGTIFAQDSSGNDINNKLVQTTIYSYPYTDANNNSWDGYLTTYFADGSYFGNTDTNNSAYWYTLEGLGLPPQQYT